MRHVATHLKRIVNNYDYIHIKGGININTGSRKTLLEEPIIKINQIKKGEIPDGFNNSNSK